MTTAMATVVFVYEAMRPINYEAFAQWLFYVTPNLKRDSYFGYYFENRVLAVIEIDLGVSRETAEQLLNNAVRLGLVRKSHVNCEGYHYEPQVAKP